ncbi:MAG: electron transfer flavoprotein-ubiquinone oxidoreductase [Cocleimonas sp.]
MNQNEDIQREAIEVDIVIVGAGPAGLSAAIRLAQLANKDNKELAITVLEKAVEVGAHSLAGAVLETRALDELIPDWREKNAPVKTQVTSDQFIYLTEKKSITLPTPPSMHNQGNYIISLGLLTRWLGEQAEALGIEIYAGFAAAEVLYDENNVVKGIATGQTGIIKDDKGEYVKGPEYDVGMELHAKTTLFAEGCRGSLSRELIEKFDLAKDASPPTYALGLKEIWEIDSSKHQQGKTVHTIGWPLKNDTYGGSFLYHLADNQIAIGFAVGLDYSNPYLSPFEEFQRFKQHPDIRPILEGGTRLSYGARALTEGGLQSLPKLDFPGGLLIGDAAGFLNVAKIKGIHTAMKSGMLSAEAIYSNREKPNTIVSYDSVFRQSWLHDELKQIRNIRPGFKKGLLFGLANAGLSTYITHGKEPWTLKHHADHLQLKKKTEVKKINYPTPDGKISFDRLSSVYLSNTNHDEKQPNHLHLKQASVAIDVNLALYDSPESRYCPAQVYEIIEPENDSDAPILQINSQNCLHCKTCDIKDPTQNIVWTTPESGGPLYGNM